MKHLIVVNPVAGKKDMTGMIREKAEGYFGRRGESYSVAVTQYAGHAVEIVEDFVRTSAPETVYVYACGGDGTLNEVLNGVIGHDNAAVTVFPTGTGNDFMKMFSGEEPFSDFGCLAEGTPVTIDLLNCNERYGIGICSIGFDARVARDMQKFKKLPLVRGKFPYILSIGLNLLRGIAQKYAVETGDVRELGEYTIVVAANGRYYGGGFYAVPDASPDDGMLDFLLVKKVSLPRFLNLVGKYSKGYFRRCPEVAYQRGKSIIVKAGKPFALNIDGEVSTVSQAHISIAEKCVRFIVPKGLEILPAKMYE